MDLGRVDKTAHDEGKHELVTWTPGAGRNGLRAWAVEAAGSGDTAGSSIVSGRAEAGA